MKLIDEESERLPNHKSEGDNAMSPQYRFLDLARKLAAVPKSEFTPKAQAFKNSKPLKPLPKPAH